MQQGRICHMELVNLKCITYAQPMPLSLIQSSEGRLFLGFLYLFYIFQCCLNIAARFQELFLLKPSNVINPQIQCQLETVLSEIAPEIMLN